MTPDQKRANRKTGLILASIALAFLLGYFAKMALLSK
jgi:hypothetical protein